MSSLVSLELRWFFGGKLSKPLFEWFRDALPGGKLQEPDTREDLYLYQPSHPDFGVKLRRKKPNAPYSMEVKWREYAKPFDGPDGVKGQVERWHKWGWDDPDGPGHRDIAPWPMPKGPWLTVSKKRWQRKYRFAGGAFTPVPNHKFPEVGVALEITALSLRKMPYATVLLEAFSPSPKQQESLLIKVIEQLWHDYPGPLPVLDRSYGYPYWLARYRDSLSVRPQKLVEV